MASSLNASNSGSGGLISTADASGVLQLQSAGTTAVTIDTSQNVGIGTTSPAVSLQVNGVIRAATANDKGVIGVGESGGGTTSNCGLWRGDANSAISGGVVSTGGNYLNLGGYAGMVFTTGAANIGSQTERMRIDSSGSLLVGTTTATAKQNIYNNVTQFGLGIEHTTASYAALMVANTASSGTRYLVDFRVSGTAGGNQQGTITSTGTNVAYNTSSDYRLKENIAPMTGALNKVSQLKPVTYTWKINGSDGEGFIAHELAEICPQAVSGEKDAIDAEGNPVYQGVDTSFLVATLTAAIQEQQTIINDLKARVTALEGTA